MLPWQEEFHHLPGRFKVLRAGRRAGKSAYLEMLACDSSIRGKYVGVFSPSYKIMTELFMNVVETLGPLVKSASKIDGVVRLVTGGRIDFWSLDNENAGRSRKYHLVLVDEAAFAKENLQEIWERAIMPTLLDYLGEAIFASNCNGIDPTNFFYRICTEPEYGFVHYHAPTSANPHMSVEELERIKSAMPPLVFKQEYLSEFVSWAGEAFFDIDKLLVQGAPLMSVPRVDYVFFTLDTAVKAGKEHDCTAIVYWGYSRVGITKQLYLLDWDITQIEGDMLVDWLPVAIGRAESLAYEYRSMGGFIGGFVEDRVSGSVLLQQARRRSMNIRPIDSKLTAAGKDERAISVSGYHYSGQCKLVQHAYDKKVRLKGIETNHLLTQLAGFRIGDKEGHKRADDLLDTYVYGLALAFGDTLGW
ncbi:unnamed protein product [Sphagnum balticum]